MAGGTQDEIGSADESLRDPDGTHTYVGCHLGRWCRCTRVFVQLVMASVVSHRSRGAPRVSQQVDCQHPARLTRSQHDLLEGHLVACIERAKSQVMTMVCSRAVAMVGPTHGTASRRYENVFMQQLHSNLLLSLLFMCGRTTAHAVAG